MNSSVDITELSDDDDAIDFQPLETTSKLETSSFTNVSSKNDISVRCHAANRFFGLAEGNPFSTSDSESCSSSDVGTPNITEFSYESSVSCYVDQHLELETTSEEDTSNSETASEQKKSTSLDLTWMVTLMTYNSHFCKY